MSEMTHICGRKLGILVLAVLFWTSAHQVRAQPYNYTITWTVKTSTGSDAGCALPVGFVWVKIMRISFWGDSELGSGWTSANGTFSVSFTSDSQTLPIGFNVRGVAWLVPVTTGSTIMGLLFNESWNTY